MTGFRNVARDKNQYTKARCVPHTHYEPFRKLLRNQVPFIAVWKGTKHWRTHQVPEARDSHADNRGTLPGLPCGLRQHWLHHLLSNRCELRVLRVTVAPLLDHGHSSVLGFIKTTLKCSIYSDHIPTLLFSSPLFFLPLDFSLSSLLLSFRKLNIL